MKTKIKGGNRIYGSLQQKIRCSKTLILLFIIGGSASFGSRKAAFNAVLHVAFFCLSGNVQSSFPFPNKDDFFLSVEVLFVATESLLILR